MDVDTPVSVRRTSTRLASLTRHKDPDGLSKAKRATSSSVCPNSEQKRQHVSESPDDKKKQGRASQVNDSSKDNKSVSGKENDLQALSGSSHFPECNSQRPTLSNHSKRSHLKRLRLNSDDEEAVAKTICTEAARSSKMDVKGRTNDSQITRDGTEMDSRHCTMATSDHTASSHPGSEQDDAEVILDETKTSEDHPDINEHFSGIIKVANEGLTISKDKKTSRRRSSFACGRKSSMFPLMAEVSHESTDHLPADQRLAKLTAASLKVSLNKLYSSLSDMEGLQQFTVQAQSAGETCIENLKNNDVFKAATVSERLIPNPANELNQEKISSLQAYVDRLKLECERWNEILRDHTSEAEIAEQNYKMVSENPIQEKPSSGLTAYEQKVLEKQINCNEMMAQLQNYKNKTCSALRSISAVVNTFQQFQRLVDNKLREHATVVYSKTFPDLKQIEDEPQRLIEAVIKLKD